MDTKSLTIEMQQIRATSSKMLANLVTPLTLNDVRMLFNQEFNTNYTLDQCAMNTNVIDELGLYKFVADSTVACNVWVVKAKDATVYSEVINGVELCDGIFRTTPGNGMRSRLVAIKGAYVWVLGGKNRYGIGEFFGPNGRDNQVMRRVQDNEAQFIKATGFAHAMAELENSRIVKCIREDSSVVYFVRGQNIRDVTCFVPETHRRENQSGEILSLPCIDPTVTGWSLLKWSTEGIQFNTHDTYFVENI